jgi:hypothetical protein
MSRGIERTLGVAAALLFVLALAAPVMAAGTKIVVEAESAHKVVKKMELITEPKLSGGKGLWVPPERPHGEGTKYTVVGHGEYTIKVPKAGKFKFWGYVAALDACGNSFGVQIDNQQPAKFEWTVGQQQYQWGWQELKKPFSLSAGEHTVKILMSEDGPKIDQWMLTSDMRRIPVKPLKETPQYIVKPE